MSRPASLRRAAGRLALALALLLAAPLPPGFAPSRATALAAGLPYALTFAPTGLAPLDRALRAASALLSLRTSVPVGGFALALRARQDRARFLAVAHGLGYYAARVAITLAGAAPDAPGLLARLRDWPAGRAVPVIVRVQPGPLFHLRRVSVRGDLPPALRAALGLAPGAPAVAASVLAAGTRLLAALRQAGYAFATVAPPQAVETPALHVLDVTFRVHAGPRVALGPVTLHGLRTMNPRFVTRELALRPGLPFAPSRIAAARHRLLALGVFDSVIVEAAPRADANGQVPLTFLLHERPLHVISATIEYETDQGLGLSAAWTDRNLFGHAERLTLSGGIGGFGATATGQPTYDAALRFTRPGFPGRQDSFAASLEALRQYLEAYDITALTAEVALTRALTPHLDLRAGFGATAEQVLQEGVNTRYGLLDLPLRLTLDTTDSRLEPTRGLRARLSLTPTVSVVGHGVAFAVASLAASTYLDLEGRGRGVLALRGLIGGILGPGSVSLPPDRRFYAGGSATVRGYAYQTAGPLFADGKPAGGASIAAGTIEFRQRIGRNWGAVGFFDAAEVGTGALPFAGTWHESVGLGLRYFTGFGPLRLDVGVPLHRPPGGASFEAYIGLGEAF
ncbi:MAG: autotransporter assembly complex protein TamA [Acetobacteraceae bacterium]